MGSGFPCDAIVGGNSNNGLHVGTFALNLNNAVSNSNWNIGAAHSYQIKTFNQPALVLHLRPLKCVLLVVKIEPIKGARQ